MEAGPDANIGIPTGATSDLLVVDCDSRNADRSELIKRWPLSDTARDLIMDPPTAHMRPCEASYCGDRYANADGGQMAGGGTPKEKKCMTKGTLDPAQLRLVETIVELGFGRIEQSLFAMVNPPSNRPPRVVQEIKIDSELQRRPDGGSEKQFETLFDQLGRLSNDIVDIEVRHSFRLVLERRYKENLS